MSTPTFPPSPRNPQGFGHRRAARPPGLAPPHLGWNEPAGLVALSFTNITLKFVTLGIYQFWGKTEVRKRIWSAIRIDGEPLGYTGTGNELFKGFVVVFGAILVPLLLMSLVLSIVLGPAGYVVSYVATLLITTYLYGVGAYRAQRYRLTRTQWRGIRGTMTGNGWGYGWTSLWTALLIPFTLGWIYPWRATRLQRMLVDDMRFGDQPFTFNENSGPLYGRFIALWVGGLILYAAASAGIAAIASTHMIEAAATQKMQLSPEGAALTMALLLGLYLIGLVASSWYRAGQFNLFAASTSFEGVPLRGTMTGLGLMALTLTNVLLVLVTFGVFAPLAQARSARYFLRHLEFTGPIAFDAIAQAAADRETKGEGLAQAFDFDAF